MARARVTVVVENTSESPELFAEHGIAFWIELGSQCVLFDTGQGGTLINNAHRLGILLSRADTIVLSHGHYDHTGGLACAMRGDRQTDVYAHPEVLRPKFARNKDGTSREIGIPCVSRQALERCRDGLALTTKPTPLSNGLTVTGPVPRMNDFEDTGGPFFLDAECRNPDPLVDDQAVFFESVQGTVVLLGCAHAGVINTLFYVHQLTGGRPIHAVLGGMHLNSASPQRLNHTIDELQKLKIEYIGPAHCTGRAATAAMRDALPDRCLPCHVGTHVEFDLLTRPAIGTGYALMSDPSGDNTVRAFQDYYPDELVLARMHA